jgi:hypothetical protein
MVTSAPTVMVESVTPRTPLVLHEALWLALPELVELLAEPLAAVVGLD